MQPTDSSRPVPGPRPRVVPEPEPGDPAGEVDLAVLQALAGLPVSGHLPVYEELHGRLMSALDEHVEQGL